MMTRSKVSTVSVLICTFNRARLLEQTLTRLQQATPPTDCNVEVIVVDNNSSDDTAAVVRRARNAGPFQVRYLVERQQGKSFALNSGLATAQGDVIALTDDDVLPAKDWLVRICANFCSADVVFVFGKVLPRWEVPPPPELLTLRARDIWGPLALIDYGDEAVHYEPESFGRKRLPVGANLALRRDAIERAGGWRTDLGRVDNTLIAGEDRELCVRLYQCGLYSGVYDPTVVVKHLVPASRLTRSYFRRWFFWHGRTLARMADAVYLDLDLGRVPFLAGVPRFVYREFVEQAGRWLRRVGRRNALDLLIEELLLIEYLGFFVEARRGLLRSRRGIRQPKTPIVLEQASEK
jgi:glycosyltransferase involved in cell wall biosynthesis